MFLVNEIKVCIALKAESIKLLAPALRVVDHSLVDSISGLQFTLSDLFELLSWILPAALFFLRN